MTTEEVAALASIIGTIVAGFAFLIRAMLRSTDKLITEMAKNHIDMMRPILEDARSYLGMHQRVQKLEDGHEELKEGHESIMSNLQSVSERIDQIFSFLLESKGAKP